jgi:TonB family protein
VAAVRKLQDPEMETRMAAPRRVALKQPDPLPVAPPTAPPVKMADFPSSVPRPVRPQAPRVVQTGAFSAGSSATPDSKLQAKQVQTGGFGDPHGANPGKGDAGRVQLAQLGNFDLPSGPGQGNGSGGASGARAIVASAGFGNGVATNRPGTQVGGTVPREAGFGGSVATGSPGNGGTRVARASGFGEALAPAPAAAPKAVVKEPPTIPVEILHKPAPQYTEEARQRRIEGEVLVEVVFLSNGSLQVVRVSRGLGHGLDEAAIRAAQQIRFKPAVREGKPVDFKATLHIVFQLA